MGRGGEDGPEGGALARRMGQRGREGGVLALNEVDGRGLQAGVLAAEAAGEAAVHVERGASEA